MNLCGRVLDNGRYRIVEKLGEGSFGSVWRATEAVVDREVAIKVLHPRYATEEHLERFLREAQAIARLEHPNIVPVFTAGSDGDVHYIVTRLLCETLRQRLAVGPIELSEVLAVAQDVGGALVHAHSHGMFHRDIKPGNIMFDRVGNAFLTDFGLVSWQGLSQLTGENILGSPAYMPPEQLMPRQYGRVDGRSDLYSLGCVIFEMVAGAAPFEGEILEVAHRHLREIPPELDARVPGTPRALAVLVARLLEKERDKRYPSAEALLGDLRALGERHGSKRRPPVPRPGAVSTQGNGAGGPGRKVPGVPGALALEGSVTLVADASGGHGPAGAGSGVPEVPSATVIDQTAKEPAPGPVPVPGEDRPASAPAPVPVVVTGEEEETGDKAGPGWRPLLRVALVLLAIIAGWGAYSLWLDSRPEPPIPVGENLGSDAATGSPPEGKGASDVAPDPELTLPGPATGGEGSVVSAPLAATAGPAAAGLPAAGPAAANPATAGPAAGGAAHRPAPPGQEPERASSAAPSPAAGGVPDGPGTRRSAGANPPEQRTSSDGDERRAVGSEPAPGHTTGRLVVRVMRGDETVFPALRIFDATGQPVEPPGGVFYSQREIELPAGTYRVGVDPLLQVVGEAEQKIEIKPGQRTVVSFSVE